MKMQKPDKSHNPKRTSNDIKRPQMTSKDGKEKDKPVSKKIRTKNSLRVGDPIDVNPSKGRGLIEQHISDSKIDRVPRSYLLKFRRFKMNYHKTLKK